MKPAFAHIRSTETYFNQGDRASCPQQFFPEFADCGVVNLDAIAKLPKGKPVILGGGGLFGVVGEAWFKRIVKSRPVFIWGAGLNYPEAPPAALGELLATCELVGLRDYRYATQNNFLWAPCASCMSPAFDKAMSFGPKYRAVVYQHSWIPLNLYMQYPRLGNMDRSKSFSDIISFLASGRTVVTNSYHGAYWAMLLGRRVILYNPEGIRFFSGLPYLPPIARSEAQLNSILDYSRTFEPSARETLDLCRDATISFKKKLTAALSQL